MPKHQSRLAPTNLGLVMTTLFARNADNLVTMDPARREILGGRPFSLDRVIELVSASADLPVSADEIIDLSGLIITPGLIRTHHHFYQKLTGVVPA